MGFFKDFKRDFAQAVNELMPEKDELAGEYDDEDMVNTFDENDNMEIAPEDMLEDIDDYGKDSGEYEEMSSKYSGDADDEVVDEADTVGRYTPVQADTSYANDINSEKLEDVPEAELIPEHDFNDLNSMNGIENTELVEEGSSSVSSDDELRAADALDEPDMLEGTNDAEKLDESTQNGEGYYGNPFEQIGEENTELQDMDLLKNIEDVLNKVEASSQTDEQEIDTNDYQYEEQAVGGLPEADQFREDVMAEVEMNSHADSSKLDDILEVDTTYITKNTKIRGNITTEGNVDVLGVVKGNVSCTGKLIVGGTIKGDVDAGEIYANAAKVEGKVIAEGSVKIGVGSIVMGDVMATSAVIAGAINGDIDVHGPVIVDSTAVVMGNIKSRSVQINNGAVIEGFCSQCYSEIDVKSFFEMESDDDDDEEDQKKNEIKPEDEKPEPAENEKSSDDAEEEKDNKSSNGNQSGKNGNGRKSGRKSGKNNGNRNKNNGNDSKNSNEKSNNKQDDEAQLKAEDVSENIPVDTQPETVETAEETASTETAEETASTEPEADINAEAAAEIAEELMAELLPSEEADESKEAKDE